MPVLMQVGMAVSQSEIRNISTGTMGSYISSRKIEGFDSLWPGTALDAFTVLPNLLGPRKVIGLLTSLASRSKL